MYYNTTLDNIVKILPSLNLHLNLYTFPPKFETVIIDSFMLIHSKMHSIKVVIVTMQLLMNSDTQFQVKIWPKPRTPDNVGQFQDGWQP